MMGEIPEFIIHSFMPSGAFDRSSFVRSLTCTKLLKVWFLEHFPFYFGSYGDKTPKSPLGRVYASLWMFLGMILMTSFTAQVSSIITADALRPLDEEFGYNV